MSQLDIALALKKELIVEYPECHQRVYVVTSVGAMLFIGQYQTPSIVILYKGGPISPQRGSSSTLDVHTFHVVIFLSVWEREAVMLGDGVKRMGLLGYQHDLTTKLNGSLLKTHYQGITSATAKRNLDVSDFPNTRGTGLEAFTGIEMQYMEYNRRT